MATKLLVLEQTCQDLSPQHDSMILRSALNKFGTMSDDLTYLPIVAGTVLALGAVALLGRLRNNQQPTALPEVTIPRTATPITTATMAGFAKTFTMPNISAARAKTSKTTAPHPTASPSLSPTRQARLAQLTFTLIVQTAAATKRARSPEYGWANYDGYADEDDRGQLHYDDDPGPFSHIPSVCSSCGDDGHADGAPLLPMPNQGGIGLSMWFI